MKWYRVTQLLFIVILFPLVSIGGTSAHATPSGIVSLDLCTDWMLIKYAQPNQIRALSELIHHYPVDWVDPKWTTHNGTLEQIITLNPALVLAGEYNALLLRKRLQELGLTVKVLSLPKSISDIYNYKQQFMNHIGHPESLSALPERATRQTEKPTGKQATLLLLGANGIGTGRNTFEDGIIQQSGWQNYLRDDGYIPLDLESVINDPPDALLWIAPHSAALANQFAEHPALIKAIPPQHWLTTDYWRWQCPGPWSWALIEQLTAHLKRYNE
ncbi:MAG: ABC transporter substrate-binding protein [Magnetococcales bacterium]|nr:ABC transporter substrate-binding protein [Magnetococcales bacterium]